MCTRLSSFFYGFGMPEFRKVQIHKEIRRLANSFALFVGLSMICYTEAQKFIESSLRRIPVKRVHGKVIVFTKMNGKLRLKVAE